MNLQKYIIIIYVLKIHFSVFFSFISNKKNKRGKKIEEENG